MSNGDFELPPAPKGHFWRVTDGPFGAFFPFVELRRKAWIFSYEVDALYQSHTEFETVEDEILYLCRRLTQAYNRREYLRKKALERMGDYGDRR